MREQWGWMGEGRRFRNSCFGNLHRPPTAHHLRKPSQVGSRERQDARRSNTVVGKQMASLSCAYPAVLGSPPAKVCEGGGLSVDVADSQISCF